MASPLKNIAFVGASGTIGRIILAALVDASEFNITALARTTSTATFPSGVTVRKSDFSSTDLQAALKGQDALISAVGATGFGEQKALIDAAIAAGVRRFLPSEFSSDVLNDVVLGLLPLFNQKREVIEYLKSKQSDLFTWTGISTSGLLDWGLANGFLGYDIATRTATIWDGGDRKYTATNEKQLGDAVISVLKRPDSTENQYLYVSSVETSQRELLAAFERATGSSWTVVNTTTEAEVSEGTKKLSQGDFSGALTLVRATTYSNLPGLGANFAKDRKLANELLGLKEERVQETVDRVVEASKKD
ncbi:hypothetical protein BJY01DRAFT_257391 [Aspergillus pseudoustus]|uniref:NmrA-like domain-containing protein n=1 Tax=Aspergillus pseudoustus TaxID=1810923 RepID=A0ABR4JKI0_9EURO